jgi:hypothetical protein
MTVTAETEINLLNVPTKTWTWRGWDICYQNMGSTGPEIAIEVALINCSLRLLHDHKREEMPWDRTGAPIAQKILNIKWVAQLFFNQLATKETVRKILLQAYQRSEAVTDELITLLTVSTIF